MIEKINLHYSFTNPASIHDEEALTALELAGRQGAKINEVVEAQNKVREDVDRQIDTVIPATIAADVKKHIENGDFDAQIDENNSEFIKAVNGDLNLVKNRVDNLVKNTVVGGTTMDAEVIDARVGHDGAQHSSLGAAIRNQFAHAMTTCAPGDIDINEVRTPGVYLKGSGDTWTNGPASLNGITAILIVLSDPSYPSRIMQAVTIAERVYLRTMYFGANPEHGPFTDWAELAHRNDIKFIYKAAPVAGAAAFDCNECRESCFISFGSNNPVINSPDVNNIGFLIAYMGANENHRYQMWFTYGGSMFYRNYVINVGWNEWKRVATATELMANIKDLNKAPIYNVQKVSNTKLYVFQRSARGFVRYELFRNTDAATNVDTYRIGGVDICDQNKTPIKSVLSYGADIEGVIFLTGASDHIGGVHGDEKYTSYMLMIDGKIVPFENVENVLCDEVKLAVESTLFNSVTGDPCFTRYKLVEFVFDGLHIHNEWVSIGVNSIVSLRSCMMSVNKDCFTHYFDSNVNRMPVARPEVTAEESTIMSNPELTDMYFVGDVNVYHKAENRTGDKLTTELIDYGARLKTYMNCYVNQTTVDGEKIKATNYIRITY